MEPERLRNGKAFEKKVRQYWTEKSEIEPDLHTTLVRRTGLGTRGRADMLIWYEDPEGGSSSESHPHRHALIVEIKCTDWDKIPLKRVRSYMRRQASNCGGTSTRSSFRILATRYSRLINCASFTRKPPRDQGCGSSSR